MQLWIHRMVPWHDILVMTAAHMVLIVVTTMSLVVMMTIRSLEIAPVVLIPIMHLEVASSAWYMILVHHLAIALGLVMRGVE